MSWGIHPIWALIISLETLYIDAICRKDLQEGLIVSERDYVSRFLTHLTYPNGPFKKKSDYLFWKASTTDGSFEKKSGTDGIIIFTYQDKYKVSLFEAKWPRCFLKGKNSWDNLYPLTEDNKKTFMELLENYNSDGKIKRFQKYSRFSKELINQKPYSHQAAIWEMFFCEAPIGTGNKQTPFFNPYGSTCVWFEQAYNFFDYYKGAFQWETWTNSELEQLFLDVKPGENVQNRVQGLSIGDIIYDILTCRKGQLLDSSNIIGNNIILKGKDFDEKEKEYKIPLYNFSNKRNAIKRNANKPNQQAQIDSYLSKSGYSYYVAIDIEKCIQSIIMSMENEGNIQ